jgi:hypothetical protein
MVLDFQGKPLLTAQLKREETSVFGLWPQGGETLSSHYITSHMDVPSQKRTAWVIKEGSKTAAGFLLFRPSPLKRP